ncbi:hypothetical protein OUZ56_005566 [Daphnia magna]|uniref:Secreted protein n=1 Tax=Daphnia magna TaxID=35525 RepID=A0ABQ9YT44_9CRUS|nr:hypothetical protein OUZ56_005566 [Daphnia magna]
MCKTTRFLPLSIYLWSMVWVASQHFTRAIPDTTGQYLLPFVLIYHHPGITLFVTCITATPMQHLSSEYIRVPYKHSE